MSYEDAEIRISDNAVFVDPTKLPDDDGRSEYTVYIPDDLTDYFEPSKPVTGDQTIRFEAYGVEPYPGYADELNEWLYRWEEVNTAQARQNEYAIRRDSSDDEDPADLTPGEVRYLKAREELGHLMLRAINCCSHDDEDQFYDTLSREEWERIAAFIQAGKTDPRVRRMMLGSIYDIRLDPEDANFLWDFVQELQESPDDWLQWTWEKGAEDESHGWKLDGDLLPMPEPPELVVDWDWPENPSE